MGDGKLNNFAKDTSTYVFRKRPPILETAKVMSFTLWVFRPLQWKSSHELVETCGFGVLESFCERP